MGLLFYPEGEKCLSAGKVHAWRPTEGATTLHNHKDKRWKGAGEDGKLLMYFTFFYLKIYNIL